MDGDIKERKEERVKHGADHETAEDAQPPTPKKQRREEDSKKGPMQKTLDDIINEQTGVTKMKTEIADPKYTMTNWELIDNSLQLRPAAIAQKRKDRVVDIPDSQDTQGMTDTQSALRMTQSQPDTGDSQQENPENTCPISHLQQMREDKEQPMVTLHIESQKNNLTIKEKQILGRVKAIHGYTQKPEYTNPDSKMIYRCPKCLSPLNSNGLEKAIRSHFKKSHATQTGLIHMRITKTDKKELSFYIQGKERMSEDLPIQQIGKLHKEATKDQGSQRPRKKRTVTENRTVSAHAERCKAACDEQSRS